MYLIPFELLFSEIARQETRSLTLIGNQMPPASDYGLLESYCPDPECDCQRVILNIVSRNEQKQVATINYGFDRSAQDAGPFLDPLNPQSAFAGALLAVIAEHLETDRAYVLRLKAHYALVKAAAADPKHPSQQKLTEWKAEGQRLRETDERTAGMRRALRVISEHEPAFKALERKTKKHRHTNAKR